MDRPYALAPHEKNEWSGASRIISSGPDFCKKSMDRPFMQSLFKRTSADEVRLAEG